MTDARTIGLADPASLRDWQTFAGLAGRLDAEAGMRVQVIDTTLVLTVSPLFPQGLTDSMPLALAMRMLPLPADAATAAVAGLDVTVPVAALLDRFARAEATGSLEIPVPPQIVIMPWAGVSPPRTDWRLLTEVDAGTVEAAAEAGITEIAAGTPQVDGRPAAGGHAVAALRSRVWGREVPELAGTPAGLAFAAKGMSFLKPDDPVRILRSGPWWRLTTAAGHVLGR